MSPKATHTPGPWAVGRVLMTPRTSKWPQEVIDDANQWERRRVFANFAAEDQGRGRIAVGVFERPEDACLAAVAPELLELLEENLADLHIALLARGQDPAHDSLFKRTRAAILRARGMTNET